MKNKFLKTATASMAFFLCSLASATPIVYTVSTDSDSDFYSYDPNTDTWSQKASITTRSQLAVDSSGIVHALTATGDIVKYDPVLDMWQTVITGANGSVNGNLEVLNDGRYLISQYGSASYQLYSGAWSTGSWGFSASHLGDYDPFSDTLVIGQIGNEAAHLVDLSDFSTTMFSNGATGTSERRRAGALLDNVFYQKWGTNDLISIDLSSTANLFSSEGDGPSNLWYPSAAADRENGLIYLGGIGSGNFGFDVYDTNTNMWSSKSTIPSGLGYHSTMIVGGVSSVADIPEPSTLAIFALSLMGLASRRFKNA